MRLNYLVLLLVMTYIVSCAPMPIPTRQAATATNVIVPTPGVVDPIAVQPLAASTDIPKLTGTPTHTGSQSEWRGDLHIHTVCSDGANTYDEIAQKALDLHLDFIAITDHVGHAERECHNESIVKCKAETRLLCLPGAELTSRLHLLAIDIHQRIDPKLSLSAWIDEIHRQGGLAIAAHPYDPRWPYSEDELYHSNLDAMECARGTPEQNELQLQLSVRYHLPCAYNSDAHYVQDIAWRHNVCSVRIASLADLKAALIAGKCRMN
jgi:hypothetical protein